MLYKLDAVYQSRFESDLLKEATELQYFHLDSMLKPVQPQTRLRVT